MAWGEVITFYSYKGGVGRSMALANTAVLLAQSGKRVLAMDFDLEAPGLLRYFKNVEAEGVGSAGVIEFFSALREAFTVSRTPIDSPSGPEGPARLAPATPELEAELRRKVAALIEEPRFIRRVWVADPNTPRGTASLWLMPAGHYDDSYPDRVRKFPWEVFYDAHPDFVDFLVEALTERFDYVLIDSRTGTTDVGNLCTVLLPEKLVLVSAPNEQSLHGATQVGRQAVEMRKASPDLRPLPIFPLLSRIENAEDDLQRKWIHDAKVRFEQVFSSVYGIGNSLTVYFDTVQIPHKSFYAYGEVIAAERERLTEARSLVAAYREFVDALRANNAIDAQSVISARLITPSRAQELAAEAQQQTQVLASRVNAAEARSLRLEERLLGLASPDVPITEAPVSVATRTLRRGERVRWTVASLGAAATCLVLASFITRGSRDSALIVQPSMTPMSYSTTAARLEVEPAFDAGVRQVGSEMVGRSASELVEVENPVVAADTALSVPEVLQIVRGDLERERVPARVARQTANGRLLVLGSYSSPAQAELNLDRFKKRVSADVRMYYATNRYYAVALALRGNGNGELIARATSVARDAYVYDAHGWLKLEFDSE